MAKLPDETEGPGLTQGYQKYDPVSTTAILFALVGLIPGRFVSLGGFHGFGPVSFTAILAIVGVLFGFLAVFRHGELQDGRALKVGVAAAGLGLIRLFIYPFLGW